MAAVAEVEEVTVAAVVATVTDQKSLSGRASCCRPPLIFLMPSFWLVCEVSLRVGTGQSRKHLMKEAPVEIEGTIHTVLPGTMFRVELQNKHLVLATLCGKMRKRWVRLTVGDRVKMEMSPYDLDKARIVWRLK